jgi:hypothetical protein
MFSLAAALRPQLRAIPDRRQNRLILPVCSVCKHDEPRVTVRTDYVLYLRCEHCAAVWSVPKPGRAPLGTSCL